VTLTATVSKGNATPQTVPFTVTVPAKIGSSNYNNVLAAVAPSIDSALSAATYTDFVANMWQLLDIVVYSDIDDAYELTANEVSLYYNDLSTFASAVINGTDTDAEKSNDLAKAILLCRAINQTVNTTWVSSMISYANSAITDAVNDGTEAVIQYLPTASFVLMALIPENGNDASTLKSTIRSLFLNYQDSLDGSWSEYTDIDAVVIVGLAAYYKENPSDTTVYNAMLAGVDYLSDVQLDNGSFSVNKYSDIGNSNTTAFVLIALAATETNPAGTDFIKNGNNVVDGLLTYYNSATSKFQFAGADNELATEQAFRSLVAYKCYTEISDMFIIYTD
jgi:hypothetical protein